MTNDRHDKGAGRKNLMETVSAWRDYLLVEKDEQLIRVPRRDLEQLLDAAENMDEVLKISGDCINDMVVGLVGSVTRSDEKTVREALKLPAAASETPGQDLTEREKKILRHALGLNCGPEAYRNFYISGPDTDEFDVLEDLATRGFVVKRRYALDQVNECYIFHATDKGQEAAGGKGAG